MHALLMHEMYMLNMVDTVHKKKVRTLPLRALWPCQAGQHTTLAQPWKAGFFFTWPFWDIKISKPTLIFLKKIIGLDRFLYCLATSERNYNLPFQNYIFTDIEPAGPFSKQESVVFLLFAFDIHWHWSSQTGIFFSSFTVPTFSSGIFWWMFFIVRWTEDVGLDPSD